jgi:hypothetical protein
MWHVSDGKFVKRFPDGGPNDGVGAIHFTPDGARVVTTGYFVLPDNSQFGLIRFWRVSDGALRQQFTEHTGIGVTAGVEWSPDVSQFIYGTYEGTVVVAQTPTP